MGKIPKEDEDPIDNIFVAFAQQIEPAFKALKFTPNGITTLSLIFGLLAAWGLYKGYIWLFALAYFISYFFDVMDGHFARRYGMTSKFGDWYDHIKDVVVAVLIIAIVFNRYKCSPKIWTIIIVLFLVMTILNATFIGCQSRLYKDGASLKLERKLCIGDPKKNIKWLRYFGPAIWTIFFIILIVLMEKKFCNS